MAEIVEFELVAKTSGAVDSVNKVDEAVKKTGRSAKKTSKELSAFAEGGKQLVSSLDRMTGGLASKFVAVGKAAKLSGKAMKSALISSGIGLAVVALGVIVEYWDDISEAIGLTNKDLERHNELLELGSGVLDSEAAYYKERKKVLINSGQDISKINKEIAENEAKQLKNLDQRIVNQRKLFDKANKEYSANRNEETRQAVVDAKKLAFALMTEREKIRNQKLEESTVVIDPKIREAEKKAALQAEKEKAKAREEADRKAKEAEKEAEKAKIEAIERIRKGLIDTEAEERAEKLRLIKEDYDQQIALAAEFYGTNSIKILELKAAQKLAEDEQQALFDEQDKARQDKLDEEEKDRKEKQLADDKKISDAAIEIAELEEKAKRTSLDGYAGAISSLSSTIGKETAAGKGLAIASSLINTYAAITGQLKTAAASPGGAIPGYAIAQAIATGVAGFVAVKKIASVKVPGGGGSGSSQTGSLPTAPTPPAFNIVGASGETQLADAIGSQTQRPARAYVVSNDVTTAQELDRNIIDGASI
jgi:hypothetical protein